MLFFSLWLSITIYRLQVTTFWTLAWVAIVAWNETLLCRFISSINFHYSCLTFLRLSFSSIWQITAPLLRRRLQTGHADGLIRAQFHIFRYLWVCIFAKFELFLLSVLTRGTVNMCVLAMVFVIGKYPYHAGTLPWANREARRRWTIWSTQPFHVDNSENTETEYGRRRRLKTATVFLLNCFSRSVSTGVIIKMWETQDCAARLCVIATSDRASPARHRESTTFQNPIKDSWNGYGGA
jgi:hypothetical protein